MTGISRPEGPQVWLQGDPEELREMMPLGIAGLVTNNLILRDMAQKYEDLRTLLDRYLELDPGALVVEVDGDTYDEFLHAAEVASAISDKVIVKVVTKPVGLRGPGNAAVARRSHDGHDGFFAKPGRDHGRGRRRLDRPVRGADPCRRQRRIRPGKANLSMRSGAGPTPPQSWAA